MKKRLATVFTVLATVGTYIIIRRIGKRRDSYV